MKYAAAVAAVLALLATPAHAEPVDCSIVIGTFAADLQIGMVVNRDPGAPGWKLPPKFLRGYVTGYSAVTLLEVSHLADYPSEWDMVACHITFTIAGQPNRNVTVTGTAVLQRDDPRSNHVMSWLPD